MQFWDVVNWKAKLQLKLQLLRLKDSIQPDNILRGIYLVGFLKIFFFLLKKIVGTCKCNWEKHMWQSEK